MLGKGACAWACGCCTAIIVLLLLAAVVSYMVLPAAMAAHTFGQATGPRNMTFPALPPLTFNPRPVHPKGPVDTVPGPSREETPTNGSGGTRSSDSNSDPEQSWTQLEGTVLSTDKSYTRATTSRPQRVPRKASAKASTGDQGKTSTGA